MPFPSACFPKANTTLQGAGFDPLSIASLTEWFDYRTLVGVGDGNPIDAWSGRKGLYTLTASGTTRSTYAADDGDGKAAAQFDSVNDRMLTTVDNFTLYGSSGDYEVWTYTKQGSPLSGTSGWVSTADSASNGVQMAANSGALFIWSPNYPGDQSLVSIGLFDSAWHLIRFSKQGARRVVQVDGSTVFDSTTSAGTLAAGSNSLILGEWNGNYMLGSYRQALFLNSVVDDETAAKLTSYLQMV